MSQATIQIQRKTKNTFTSREYSTRLCRCAVMTHFTKVKFLPCTTTVCILGYYSRFCTQHFKGIIS